MNRPFGRTLIEALASGIVCTLPLGLWVSYRALPFNETLSLSGRYWLLAYLCGVYVGVGVLISVGLAVALHFSPRWRERTIASVAVLLLPAWGAWFYGARWGMGGGFVVGAIFGASVVLAVLLTLGALSRGRHGTVLLLALIVELALVIRLPMHQPPAAADPELLARLREPGRQAVPPVMVLAIDGMEAEILEAGIARGELPHLESVWLGGLRAPLGTLEPTWSPPLWTSFWTGKLPKDHGINYFLAQGSYRLPDGGAVVVPRLLGARWAAERLLRRLEIPVNQKQRRATALWEILGLAGRESVLVNRLVSWPVLPLRGVELSSRLLLDGESPEALAYPDSLAPIARERLASVLPLPDPALAAVPWLARDLAREAELWRMGGELAVERDASLLLLYTHLIDSAQHRYLKYHWPDRYRFGVDPEDVEIFGQVVQASYRHVDAMVGGLLATFPGARVLLISDHGVVPNQELTEDLPERRGVERIPAVDEASVSGVHGHAPDGVFALAGPGIEAAAEPLGGVELLEIAPLLLRLLDLPWARDLERGAPERILRGLEGLPAAREPVSSYEGIIPRDIGLWAGGSDDAVLEELRALGYIE